MQLISRFASGVDVDGDGGEKKGQFLAIEKKGQFLMVFKNTFFQRYEISQISTVF